MDQIQINQQYDSHVHWLATGDVALGLHLGFLKNLQQLQNLEIKKEFFRGDWIYGFGWNENNFDSSLSVNRKFLDQTFPNQPVLFSRVDGHSSWLNTKALLQFNFIDSKGLIIESEYSPFIAVDSQGYATGLISEKAHMKALFALPALSHLQIKERLLKAQEIFLSQGFTHIRDMTSDLKLWEAAQELEREGLLKIHVEFNFSCENRDDFKNVLSDFKSIFEMKSKYLKPRGIKIFFDGSLGSGTALLQNEDGSIIGNQLWSNEDLMYLIKETWAHGYEISIHTLGDEAVHRVVQIARQVSAGGINGILNLEHVEVLRNETIKLMKPLHIRCHMQPCHWHSDKVWLHAKLKNKISEAFPWEKLRVNQIPFFFGSDSPIEPPSVIRNFEALEYSVGMGIKMLNANPVHYHQYPRKDGIQSTSHYIAGQLSKLEIDS